MCIKQTEKKRKANNRAIQDDENATQNIAE